MANREEILGWQQYIADSYAFSINVLERAPHKLLIGQRDLGNRLLEELRGGYERYVRAPSAILTPAVDAPQGTMGQALDEVDLTGNMGQIKRTLSDRVIGACFVNDAGYKRAVDVLVAVLDSLKAIVGLPLDSLIEALKLIKALLR